MSRNGGIGGKSGGSIAWFRLFCFIFFIITTIGNASEENPEASARVQLMKGQTRVVLRAEGDLVLEAGGKRLGLPAGVYTVTVEKAQPARQRFHLFSKTFQVNERAEEAAYLAEWRAKGYDPRIVVVGREFRTNSGAVLDNRVHWVSLARAESEKEAGTIKARLEAQNQWTWMRAETIEPGNGGLIFTRLDGRSAAPVEAPAKLRSLKPIEVSDVDVGFWKEQKDHRPYMGELELGVGPDGRLEVVETVELETYLRGVVPAEMPASWPLEALKAQAVAARSEVMANLGAGHALEGFDFCGSEHCRAYRGSAGGMPNTDKAVAETRGRILAREAKIVPAVFSSNCGGWTEANETAWRAPAQPALRPVHDGPGKVRGETLGEKEVRSWLAKPDKAYCEGDKAYFRWKKTYTVDELSNIVNKRHAVGRIKSIRLGERGAGGRLEWVRIEGTKKTETIHKELPIRQAFGGLPSALFVLDSGGGKYTFTGAGRGHGVGLCQHGARGMAERGSAYDKILQHYFTGVSIERVR